MLNQKIQFPIAHHVGKHLSVLQVVAVNGQRPVDGLRVDQSGRAVEVGHAVGGIAPVVVVIAVELVPRILHDGIVDVGAVDFYPAADVLVPVVQSIEAGEHALRIFLARQNVGGEGARIVPVNLQDFTEQRPVAHRHKHELIDQQPARHQHGQNRHPGDDFPYSFLKRIPFPRENGGKKPPLLAGFGGDGDLRGCLLWLLQGFAARHDGGKRF